jgi:hypothetical protein
VKILTKELLKELKELKVHRDSFNKFLSVNQSIPTTEKGKVLVALATRRMPMNENEDKRDRGGNTDTSRVTSKHSCVNGNTGAGLLQVKLMPLTEMYINFRISCQKRVRTP